MTSIRLWLLRCSLGVIMAPGLLQAQLPPDEDWRTLQTEHFRVTFAAGLEPLARHAGERAESVRERLAGELAAAPDGPIDIVLTDHADFSNGFARPFPSNRITLYVEPPVDDLSLMHHDDWIDLVLTHELVHIFHFDQTAGLGRLLRGIFGRLPSTWPLFPVVYTPTWSTEGLATYMESRLTGTGRLYGSYHDMIVRTAVLEDAFPSVDQAGGRGPAWPAGESRYVFGSRFLAHLARTHGPDVPARLVDATAGAWIPPVLRFDGVAKNALGESFTAAWDDWRDSLEAGHARLADSLRAQGLTTADRLTRAGRYAVHPRVSPDGERVAFAEQDGRDRAATRVIDAGSGAVHTVAERNQGGGLLGPATWLPDGRSLVVAQLEYRDPYRLRQDLYRVGADGSEQRLTTGARLSEPDAAPDGRRVVAVQSRDGTNRLVVYDLETGALRPITAASPGRYWSAPRWSPDGATIAAARWSEGGYHDIVVLDTAGAPRLEPSHDRAIDAGPVWSPDGRYIIFWSDRGGIPNLFAWDLEPGAEPASDEAPGRTRQRPLAASAGSRAEDPAPRLYQITNVLTGAFYPDVSPDGRRIYFAGYDADGFHIERMPFEPSAWREPAPLRSEAERRAGAGQRTDGVDTTERVEAAVSPAAVEPDGPPAPRTGVAAPAGADTASIRPYSALPSLAPRFWVPLMADRGPAGTFLGALTHGRGLVGRHAYDVWAAVDPKERRWEGGARYRYAGLGNPTLELELDRSWDGVRVALSDGSSIRQLWTEDHVSLSATALRRRWGAAAWLAAGAEATARRYSLPGSPDTLALRDPEDDLVGLVGGVGYADARRHAYSISPEGGVSASLRGRRRWDRGAFTDRQGNLQDGSYGELVFRGAAYKDIRLFGFADHVVGLRTSALRRTGPGAVPEPVGGASGGPLDVGVGRLGAGSVLLPVRGHARGAVHGTRAWSASLEHRFPIALVERGFHVWPVFLDRISGSLFLDAGDGDCDDAVAERYDTYCTGAGPLAGAGAELSVDIGFGFGFGARLRGGVGFPVRGGGSDPVYYVRLGPSF